MFVDQSQDLGSRRLHRLLQIVEAPAYVKSAKVEHLCGGPDSDPITYADPARRRFSCHTKAATWTSALYFFDQRVEEPDPCDLRQVEARIRQAAALHGITEDVEKVARALHDFKTADPDANLTNDDFALVLPSATGVTRHFPLRNAAEVKAAAEYIQQHRRKLPYEARQAMADRVLAKAATYGANLPGELGECIRRTAGHGLCAASDACRVVIDRIDASRRGPGRLDADQAGMAKLAQTIAGKPTTFRNRDSLIKVAAIVDAFDRKMGLHNTLTPVEDVLFALTYEKAASFTQGAVETATGRLYRKADLESLRVSAIRDALGDEFARSVTRDGIHVDGEKMASCLREAPRAVSSVFDTVAPTLGVVPFAHTPRASVIHDEDEMQRMAEWVAERRAARYAV